MTSADPEHRLAGAIVASRFGLSGPVEVRVLGQGSNNTVYLAAAASAKRVVKLSRPHREAGALGEFRKELWCANTARAAGVKTPQVLEAGVWEGRAFEVLALVEGQMPCAADEARVWRVLGEAARRIHAVPVRGWGFAMESDGVFAAKWTWKGHLEYNLASLTPQDALIARGVLDAASSARLRRTLERLAKVEFRFGLCHGDIALRNTLIDGAGEVWLLDWGCAGAHVVPHYEINEIRRAGAPPRHFESFLDGYGLSAAALAALEPELCALAALREVDTLRWALEQQPDLIEELGARAREAVAKLD